MIKLNFIINFSNFSMTINHPSPNLLFTHHHYRLNIELASFQNILLSTDAETEIIELFKNCEWCSLNLCEWQDYSEKKPDVLYAEVSKDEALYSINIAGEMSEEYLNKISPYIPLLNSEKIISNILLSLSADTCNQITEKIKSEKNIFDFEINNFELTFSNK
ncbi:MAG: hypothetical protein K9J78_10475 [Polynucleobacter sp.]|nr:hypothetical protein [Polynucleobacter sp.]